MIEIYGIFDQQAMKNGIDETGELVEKRPHDR